MEGTQVSGDEMHRPGFNLFTNWFQSKIYVKHFIADLSEVKLPEKKLNLKIVFSRGIVNPNFIYSRSKMSQT